MALLSDRWRQPPCWLHLRSSVVRCALAAQLVPDLTASDAELSAWYSDTGNRSSLTVGLSMSVYGAVSFLWFVAVIRRRVGDVEDKFFSTVFLGSGILLTAVMLGGAAARAGPAIVADLADGRESAPVSF